MSGSAFEVEVRRRLQSVASRQVKQGAEAYFKHQVRFLGVKTPGLRAVARDLWPAFGAQPIGRQTDQALGLLHSPYMEERQVGVELLYRARHRIPDRTVIRLEPVFDKVVSEWGTCDGIAGRFLRPLVHRSPWVRARMLTWSRSANSWRQRAAAVAFVTEARHGTHNATILRICGNLIRNPDRFTQLGMGWVLREVSLADRDAVTRFLTAHLFLLRREALRYAIEKMPKGEARRLLRLHQRRSLGARSG